MTIDMDLEDLDGVEESRTNYAKQVTEVKFNSEKISPDKIIETIKKTGYGVV
jgi:copper chaperone CopZ